MVRRKSAQTAKSLEGTYVLDGHTLQANHKLSSIWFIYMKDSHLNTLPDPCVMFVYVLVTRAYYLFQVGLELTMSALAS